jgi:DNA mismatch repair ATPase MutS
MEYLFNFESLLDDLFHKKSKIEVELDETEIHSNLDIFTTGVNNKNRSVLNTLVEPITKEGVIYLQKRLSQSRTLQEIKREQKELIFLLKNPEILNEIYTILRFIQKQEDSLLWCITDKTGSEIDSLSSGYFQHEFLQFLNKYSSVLFLMNVFTLLIAPIYSTLSPVILPKHKSFEKVFNSYTHDWSPVLQEYNKIIQFVSVKEKLREDIKHMYQSWGHIDFLVSLARTLIEGEWCIPYFRKDNIPYLSIKDMYHPSLKGSCIKNTIKMENENMLITGPNASGKSTLLKTTAIGVFLAHRLGIAPGKRMETSYFRYIYTHLNIQDATGKESLFQREANKIKKQIQMMNQKDGLHFSIIDELFHSTNPGEAVKGAKWILSQINNNPRVMCLLSTHFHDLTVSDSSIDKFKCYHIPFIRDEKGKIKYTYTLQPGVSQQNVALEILQNTDD